MSSSFGSVLSFRFCVVALRFLSVLMLFIGAPVLGGALGAGSSDILRS